MLGVPVINPVLLLNVKPAGNTGSIRYSKVPPPPVAVTGATGVATTPIVSIIEGTANVATKAGADCIVRLKFLLSVADALSVMLTVNEVEVIIVVGVPVISPVLVLKLKPVGKELLIANVYIPVPPVAVTGLNGVTTIPTVIVLLLIDCVAVNGGLVTLNVKLLLLVCCKLSVAVTI